MKRRICIGLAVCILCFASVAQAIVQIDFNGMTGTGSDIAGQTDGIGLGVWSGDTKIDVMGWTDFTAPASTNFGLTQDGTGRVANGDGPDQANNYASAALTTSLTGSTIWGSFLLMPDYYSGIGFNTTGDGWADPVITSMSSGRLRIRAGTGDLTTANNALTAGTVAEGNANLILFRILVDNDGDNDDVDVWINPDVAAALPTADLTLTGDDWLAGSSIDRLGIVGYNANNDDGGVDLITLSDGVNAYFDVTGIPEPATMLLLGLGGLVLRRRRR